MSEKYKEAIDRLKDIAKFNKEFADRILNGEIQIHFCDAESMARTYYFWSNSCSIAAWLLEHDHAGT